MYPSFIFTALLAMASTAIATPPACLIAAMGAQPNPGDMKAICGTLEAHIASNITEKCSGAAESSAISIYAATCLSAQSVTISITTASPTSAGKTSATVISTVMPTIKTTGSSTRTGPTATSSGTDATSTSGVKSITPEYMLLFIAAGFAGQHML